MQDNINKRYSKILGDEASFVELSAVLPDPLRNQGNMDTWIVNGARVSYRSKANDPEKDAKLITYLLENKHMSPFEQPQATFTFRMPKMAVIQFLRHRAFHVNSESGRYSEVKDEFYIPDFRLQSKTNKQMSGDMMNEHSNEIVKGALTDITKEAMNWYHTLVANGTAKELARAFLPSDISYQTLVFTGDLRNIMHFMELRCDEHAQWEIRQMACAMYWLLRPHAPVTLDYFLNYQATISGTYNIHKFFDAHGEPNG